MKFRFCGDGDCPDWVLAEIISTLSTLDGTAFEKLSISVAKKIVGKEFDESEVKELCKDLVDNGKSAISCVHFLLINATRHGVSEEVFSEEIQQLGLPKEHSKLVCKVLTIFREEIQNKLIQKSIKINELSSIKCVPVDENDGINCYRLELKVSQELVNGLPEDTLHTLHIEKDNLKAFINELKIARSIMQKYDVENTDPVKN